MHLYVFIRQRVLEAVFRVLKEGWPSWRSTVGRGEKMCTDIFKLRGKNKLRAATIMLACIRQATNSNPDRVIIIQIHPGFLRPSVASVEDETSYV
jgi:hypothetical protein